MSVFASLRPQSKNGSPKQNNLEKAKAEHARYLAAYKELNGGSTEGATPFRDFLLYRLFINKYGDGRVQSLTFR